MRILVHSNAPWAATGYGQQTAQLVPRLDTAGHEVAISAIYGLNGAMQSWHGIPIYPGGNDHYANDVVGSHALHHLGDPRFGWILTLFDVWALTAPSLREFNIAAWTPVDHDPVPPSVLGFFHKTGALPVAMSRFGQRQLEGAGLDTFYAPHAIDTDLFKPQDTSWARKKLGAFEWTQDSAGNRVTIPGDAFVIGMNAANRGMNPPRKAFPQVFEAFRRFAGKHRDALLFLHTEIFGTYQGLKLLDIAMSLGIADRIIWTDQYAYRLGVSQETLAQMYSAMDVLVNPSFGEGFGIPIIEAQACGTPVIVNDFSSMTELCGAGWLTEGDPYWDGPHESWFQIPSIGSIESAMRQAYKNAESRGRKARPFAEQFDADMVFDEYWQPILAEMDERVRPVETPDLQPIP